MVEKGYNILKSKKMFAFVCLLIFIGLFVSISGLLVTRLEKEIWNLGHLFGFFVIWLFLLNLFPTFLPTSLRRIGLVVLYTVIASGCIEVIQYFIGRSASIYDIGLNLAGTLIALGIFILLLRPFAKHNYTLVFFMLVLVSVFILPGARVLLDEIHLRQQFPVLSDYSKPFEIGRWNTSNARINISNVENNKVLVVTLLPTGKYSSVALASFGGDWSGYRELVFDIVNKEVTELPITIRVHDSLHDNRYDDRFNKTFKLPSGVSSLSIKILDIYKSPKGRSMDLSNIAAVALFAIDLDKEKVIQLKKIYLR